MKTMIDKFKHYSKKALEWIALWILGLTVIVGFAYLLKSISDNFDLILRGIGIVFLPLLVGKLTQVVYRDFKDS